MRFHHLSHLLTGPTTLLVIALPYVPNHFSGSISSFSFDEFVHTAGIPNSPNLAISSRNNAETSRRADDPDAFPLDATNAAAGTGDDWASISASENEVVAAGISLPEPAEPERFSDIPPAADDLATLPNSEGTLTAGFFIPMFPVFPACASGKKPYCCNVLQLDYPDEATDCNTSATPPNIKIPCMRKEFQYCCDGIWGHRGHGCMHGY